MGTFFFLWALIGLGTYCYGVRLAVEAGEMDLEEFSRLTMFLAAVVFCAAGPVFIVMAFCQSRDPWS